VFGLFGKKVLKEPIHFLYTRTFHTDYEYKNEFTDNEKLNSVLKNDIDITIGELCSFEMLKCFIDKKIDSFRIICFKVYDGRFDNAKKQIISYLGVVVDVKDRDFDIQNYIRRINGRINVMGRNQYDVFIMAQGFPIIWDKSKDLPIAIKNDSASTMR